MIYQMKLVIRDEERDITDFIYHCHISHHNDPDLDKMIELHIKVCEEIGNREDLPVEGDLIALTFNSTNHDQFFYDWLFEGAMHNGEIQFIYNEVETADIFRFWDCYCLGLEESMSVGGAPMRITIYLSPGIIKRNNLEAREKVWKVSSPSTDKKMTENEYPQDSIAKPSQKVMSQSSETTINKSDEPYVNIHKNEHSSLVDSEININQLLNEYVGLPKISEEDTATAIDACKRALDIKKQLPMTNKWINKTVASDSIVVVSGWTDRGNFTKISPEKVFNYCSSIGAVPFSSGGLDHIRNNGFIGKFNCSHAEKKILSHKPNEIIGVSKEMCPDCIRFCKAQAKNSQKKVVVADPKIIHIFTPDGEETRFINPLNEE